MKTVRTALTLALLIAAGTVSAQVSTKMAPLSRFEGGCWSGQLPSGEIDQHCFTWVYSNQFLRDRHRVFRDGKAGLQSESIYYWEPGSGNLRYLWFNSEGGTSQGVVRVEGDRYFFPDEVYRSERGTRTFRTTYVFPGADAYESVVEEMKDGQWQERWRVKMERQR